MSGSADHQAIHSRDAVWRTMPLTREYLHSILPQWRDLWQKAGERNLFLSPDFLLSSLPLLASKRPMLITAFQGERLIGLMVMRSDIGYAKLPIGFWRSALHAEQYLGTPLVMEGEEDHFAKGLGDWLDRSDSSRCFVKIAYISADCDLANAVKRFCANDERVSFEQGRHVRAAISLASGDAEFDAHLSANRRRSLRKARRKLENLGAVEIESLTDSDALLGWIDDFLKLENSGWKGAEGSSILSNPHETELYRSLIQSAFDEGALHFSRLCIDSKPIAYTLDIHAIPFAFCLKSAIDPDYRSYSPGVLMEYETLRHYRNQTECEMVDSCTSADNALLNELWPDRKPIVDLVIGRKGFGYGAIARLVRRIKRASADQKD